MPSTQTESSIEDTGRVFELQKANRQEISNSSHSERKEKLRRLRDAIMDRREEIRDALQADFGKHPSEVDLTEIYPVTGEIKHALRHLGKWMRPQRVSVPISQFGSRSYIHYEPKGVTLIISPWNFPVSLTFGPLVSAIAAGNTAILKPSEHTPNAAAVMKKIVEELFEENEVALFQGGVETSTTLLELPLNHIFFTGSPAVGKIVMAAAAKHLASVTLELGGKSPTIIDETADIKTAAARIAWAKCINNGQVCIAPDHVYVHQSKRDEFLALLQENIEKFYGSNPQQSPSYSRIVNDHHFGRLRDLLGDAVGRQARVECGGQTDEDDNYIAPTVLTDVTSESRIMQEEIFGPLLPIHTFSDLEEPIAAINSRQRPLALYIFSRDRRNVEYIIRHSRAGGTCINHSGVHFFNYNLPFGGINNSGVGKSHGHFGFRAFSNARAVYRQSLPWNAIDGLMPPYTDFKQKLIDLTIKWF